MSENEIKSSTSVWTSAKTLTWSSSSYLNSSTEGTSLSLETKTNLSTNGVQLNLEILATSQKLSLEQKRFILDRITEVLNESSTLYAILHPSTTDSPA